MAPVAAAAEAFQTVAPALEAVAAAVAPAAPASAASSSPLAEPSSSNDHGFGWASFVWPQLLAGQWRCRRRRQIQATAVLVNWGLAEVQPWAQVEQQTGWQAAVLAGRWAP